jgi:hypothetical protein
MKYCRLNMPKPFRGMRPNGSKERADRGLPLGKRISLLNLNYLARGILSPDLGEMDYGI